MKVRLTLILIFCMAWSFAQTKTEYEKRISKDSFPQLAQEVLKILPSDTEKKRFFKELSGDKVSYEVKFRYQKQHYSVEFSETGQLEDIEINVKEKSITPKVKSVMERHFEERYKKYRWLKIQEQYNYKGKVSAIEFVKKVLGKEIKSPPFYEIVAEVKKNRSYILKEYNFNDLGALLQEKIIDPESYAHVLY